MCVIGRDGGFRIEVILGFGGYWCVYVVKVFDRFRFLRIECERSFV